MSQQPIPNSVEWFNNEYDSGGWGFLDSLDELARYSIITGYIGFLKEEAPVILDVGCGTGILRSRLGGIPLLSYDGIDFSEAAVRQAQGLADNETRFLVTTPREFEADRRYDFIVFNEYLYYDEAYLETVRHLSQFLTDDGHLIVSMYATNENMQIFQALDKVCDQVDQTKIGNTKGMLWLVQLLRPKAAGA